MVVFVGTPQLRRIALWVAMETIHLDIHVARISFFLGTNFWGMTWVPMNNSTPLGSKVGQIRSYGTSNMILIACF